MSDTALLRIGILAAGLLLIAAIFLFGRPKKKPQGRRVENAEPTSPFGTKALGEPPACPGAPAIRNAILNATGVAINQTPMTPHVLFEKFREAGLL